MAHGKIGQNSSEKLSNSMKIFQLQWHCIESNTQTINQHGNEWSGAAIKPKSIWLQIQQLDRISIAWNQEGKIDWKWHDFWIIIVFENIITVENGLYVQL